MIRPNGGRRLEGSLMAEDAGLPEAQFLVFSNAAEGQDEEFNRWYDAKHLPDVLAVPGIVDGQRYRRH
jgi:hypothetical protein